MLPFVIIGLTSGSIYALAGLGLVLTYKTSGVFNFAHAALATVAAYVFYALFVLNGWAWPLAALVAVAVVGPTMGIGVRTPRAQNPGRAVSSPRRCDGGGVPRG